MYGYIGHSRGFSGHVQGETQAFQLPSALQLPCKRVILRGDTTNLVYVGFNSAVSTVATAASSTTAGFMLSSGDGQYLELDIQHTNQLWFIAASTSSGFSIIILS
jgi:hypothetical protein